MKQEIFDFLSEMEKDVAMKTKVRGAMVKDQNLSDKESVALGGTLKRLSSLKDQLHRTYGPVGQDMTPGVQAQFLVFIVVGFTYGKKVFRRRVMRESIIVSDDGRTWTAYFAEEGKVFAIRGECDDKANPTTRGAFEIHVRDESSTDYTDIVKGVAVLNYL